MKKYGFLVAVCLLIAWLPFSAQAHMLWLNANNYSPAIGETVFLEIGFGHQYPRDEVIKEGSVESVYALGAEGQKIGVDEIFPTFYKFTPPAAGLYQVIAVMKPGFVSKTTEGMRLGSKKDHANAVDCFAFRMTAEALIAVGPKGGLVGESKNPLEIVAMKNPLDLKVGETLPLKILFEGKPLAGAEVQAADSSQGAAVQEHTGHGAGMKNQHWTQETESNSEGIAQIELNSKGPWMFTILHKTPYPDKDVCNDYSYRTSLTMSF
jgi:uncharacterized GH25 family protein